MSKIAELIFKEDFSGRILSFDQKAAVNFAQIASHRRKIGQPISQADAQMRHDQVRSHLWVIFVIYLC